MQDPVAAFCEVFKYAVKFAELPDAERLHAYHTLRGKRLVDSFGDFRGLDIEPNDQDEILEDLPYIERLFVYQGGAGYVEKECTGEIHIPDKTHKENLDRQKWVEKYCISKPSRMAA
jgi:hypothetical protein